MNMTSHTLRGITVEVVVLAGTAADGYSDRPHGIPNRPTQRIAPGSASALEQSSSRPGSASAVKQIDVTDGGVESGA